MSWFVVYRSKSLRGSLQENLEKASIPYYIPTQVVEKFEVNRMVEHEELVFHNILFIQTQQDIYDVTHNTDGLLAPYIDKTTDKPAVISDAEMQRFQRVLELKNYHADFLQDALSRFTTSPKVRVKEGEFKGLEGYLFRIRGDRKVVIGVGGMAVAISGIHVTLLEVVE